MPRVMHFEIHADNPERAVGFYTKVFGWSFKNWGGPMEYWLVTTGPDGQPGINGGARRPPGPPPRGRTGGKTGRLPHRRAHPPPPLARGPPPASPPRPRA